MFSGSPHRFGMASGQIIEADIAFNGLHHQWTTGEPINAVDVKSVVLHEVGHWFGIQHYLLKDFGPGEQPTMAPAWGAGQTETRTLEEEDIRPFCFLYGDKSCSTDEDCPYVVGDSGGNEVITGKYNCNAGTCSLGDGGGNTTTGGGLSDSCAGYCGGPAPAGCYCDEACIQFNDCCPDYQDECVADPTEGGGTDPTKAVRAIRQKVGKAT